MQYCCLCLRQGADAATAEGNGRLRAAPEAQASATAAARTEADSAARENSAMLIQGTAQPGAQRGAWAAAAAPARSAGRHWAAPVWVPAERGRQRQRRGGRAHRGSWAHRGAGMPPARRARAADRPCVYPVRRSWTHGNPRAAAALCACGRDVATGGGSGQTSHGAHRRRGRAANGGGSPGGGRRYLDAREAGWVAAAATTRATEQAVCWQGRGKRGCLKACCG